MKQAKRILKPNGSLYIISGWSNLLEILQAAKVLSLNLVNHIIWKFNFGVATTSKFVTSHYHVLYLRKEQKPELTFNRFCRYGPNEKDIHKKSLVYQDMEDVWVINKEYHPNKKKNKNKLPEELIKKILLYSSHEGDTVCDFFMGNFTTASASIQLGRTPIGFELNKDAYEHGMKEIEEMKFGQSLQLKEIDHELPDNQGKPISDVLRQAIIDDFLELANRLNKKQCVSRLCEKYKRGKFSILNIVSEL